MACMPTHPSELHYMHVLGFQQCSDRSVLSVSFPLLFSFPLLLLNPLCPLRVEHLTLCAKQTSFLPIPLWTFDQRAYPNVSKNIRNKNDASAAYPNVSKHIQTHPNVSKIQTHIQSYPYSNNISTNTYPNVSKNTQTYPKHTRIQIYPNINKTML